MGLGIECIAFWEVDKSNIMESLPCIRKASMYYSPKKSLRLFNSFNSTATSTMAFSYYSFSQALALMQRSPYS